MKIEVFKYNSDEDFYVIVDGIIFTEKTESSRYTGIVALSEYIIATRCNAVLIEDGGTILDKFVGVETGGKTRFIAVGTRSHWPDNAKYFANVVNAHMKVLIKEIERIRSEPKYTIEL